MVGSVGVRVLKCRSVSGRRWHFAKALKNRCEKPFVWQMLGQMLPVNDPPYHTHTHHTGQLKGMPPATTLMISGNRINLGCPIHLTDTRSVITVNQIILKELYHKSY